MVIILICRPAIKLRNWLWAIYFLFCITYNCCSNCGSSVIIFTFVIAWTTTRGVLVTRSILLWPLVTWYNIPWIGIELWMLSFPADPSYKLWHFDLTISNLVFTNFFATHVGSYWKIIRRHRRRFVWCINFLWK